MESIGFEPMSLPCKGSTKPSQLRPLNCGNGGNRIHPKTLQGFFASLGTCAPIEGPEIFILLRHGPRAFLERIERIELSSPGWKPDIICLSTPLYDIRIKTIRQWTNSFEILVGFEPTFSTSITINGFEDRLGYRTYWTSDGSRTHIFSFHLHLTV